MSSSTTVSDHLQGFYALPFGAVTKRQPAFSRSLRASPLMRSIRMKHHQFSDVMVAYVIVSIRSFCQERSALIEIDPNGEGIRLGLLVHGKAREELTANLDRRRSVDRARLYAG